MARYRCVMPTRKSDKQEKSSSSSIEAFEKFQKLATLALDDTNEEESRNAAVKAIEMLEGEDPELVVLPRAEVEQLKKGIEGARDIVSKTKAAKREGMMVGALLGLGLAKTKLLG